MSEDRKPEHIEPAEYYPGVSFGKDVQVCGIRGISIGDGSCISDGSWLNDCIRDGKVRIRIGRCVLVGRRGTISTAGELEIGSYSILAPNVYVSDADHDYRNIHVPILMGGVTADRRMVVEENCWLCTNSVVTGSLTVGRGSVVGANAVVLKDIPPFCVVVGNPSRIVKMYDPALKEWVRVRNNEEIERADIHRAQVGLPSREEYLQMLSECGLDRIDPIVTGRGQHLY